MRKSLFFSLVLLLEIGAVTAIPVLVLGYFGRYLDRIYQINNFLFIIGLILAAVITIFSVRTIAKNAVVEFEKLNK